MGDLLRLGELSLAFFQALLGLATLQILVRDSASSTQRSSGRRYPVDRGNPELLQGSPVGCRAVRLRLPAALPY